jgi:indole-3-glycerol phosphate synthase
MRLDDAAVRRREEQNRAASRPDTRAITPSIRNFAQAIDRQRQSVEHVPVLMASHPRLVEVARSLDEAEVAAIAMTVDDPGAELEPFSAAAAAVSVPVLRSDLILEEFQIYQSRAAGADAVLLHARLFGDEQLERLCSAARATHMAACVACETPDEVRRAVQSRAAVIALARPDEALFAGVPPRFLVVALDPAAAVRGRADALLDDSLGTASDPVAAFRALLEGD